MMYPLLIHLPTLILLNTLVDKSIPVIAPKGESSNESPSVASVRSRWRFTVGIAATHIPNTRLLTENKKPTDNAGLFFINEEIVLNM